MSLISLSSIVLLMIVRGGGSAARSGLRWDVSEGGGLVRTLSDAQQIVTLEYNERGELVQCWETKAGRTPDAIALMFYSAMSDTRALRKDAVEIDVKNVMKQCQSYMKQVFAGNDTRLQEEIERIAALRDGFDGSKWCGLDPKKSKSKALKREDRCCKKWHECSLCVPAYGYEHMLYNYRPYPLLGCNCTVELEACLRNVTASSLAEEILEIQFGSPTPYPVCLTEERRKTHCVKWDSFYHKCTKYEWAHYADVKTLAEYRLMNTRTAERDEEREEFPDRKAQIVKEETTPRRQEL